MGDVDTITIIDVAPTVITYDPEVARAAVEPIVILTPSSFPYESDKAELWSQSVESSWKWRQKRRRREFKLFFLGNKLTNELTYLIIRARGMNGARARIACYRIGCI